MIVVWACLRLRRSSPDQMSPSGCCGREDSPGFWGRSRARRTSRRRRSWGRREHARRTRQVLLFLSMILREVILKHASGGGGTARFWSEGLTLVAGNGIFLMNRFCLSRLVSEVILTLASGRGGDNGRFGEELTWISGSGLQFGQASRSRWGRCARRRTEGSRGSRERGFVTSTAPCYVRRRASWAP